MILEKVTSKDAMKDTLRTSDVAVKEALRRLYLLQTDEEREGDHPDDLNGLGFNKFDAPILQTLAERLIVYKDLKKDEIVVARSRIVKYANQLLKTNAMKM